MVLTMVLFSLFKKIQYINGDGMVNCHHLLIVMVGMVKLSGRLLDLSRYLS